MKQIRKPTIGELNLINYLISKSDVDFPENYKHLLMVMDMEDGNMGSLKLYPEGIILHNKSFGKQISEYQFKDVDNISVIASLYIDKEGDLYELDIWKTDFSPLIKLPDNFDLLC